MTRYGTVPDELRVAMVRVVLIFVAVRTRVVRLFKHIQTYSKEIKRVCRDQVRLIKIRLLIISKDDNLY